MAGGGRREKAESGGKRSGAGGKIAGRKRTAAKAKTKAKTKAQAKVKVKAGTMAMAKRPGAATKKAGGAAARKTPAGSRSAGAGGTVLKTPTAESAAGVPVATAVRTAPAPKGPFVVDVKPDWEAFIANIRRQGTPKRVHFIELFLDVEVQDAICERYGVDAGLDRNDPFFNLRRKVAIQRFLGYDYIRICPAGMDMPTKVCVAPDTAELSRASGRKFMEEHKGPITCWAEFHAYPWPDPAKADMSELEWCEKNLPDDMCVIVSGVAHYAEYLSWLMGYETLCYALTDQRDLVRAIADRLTEIYRVLIPRMLQFKRVKALWGSDDMGYRGGTLMHPKDMREFVLPGHRMAGRMAHEAGMPYLLHSCGNLKAIMEDLIEDVGIDAKHSFEDTIESVIEAKGTYGRRISLLGGIDVDFMCRSDAQAVRERVRKTLDACMPGGGYCLGSGNSVANYIPLDNYLAMLDEGRRFGR
ncbi:MAG: hypothetical protein N3A38_05490 [Planctomycetota bacterium]|nr:hypothetical protein [Planctomycetota bacterium]